MGWQGTKHHELRHTQQIVLPMAEGSRMPTPSRLHKSSGYLLILINLRLPGVGSLQFALISLIATLFRRHLLSNVHRLWRYGLGFPPCFAARLLSLAPVILMRLGSLVPVIQCGYANTTFSEPQIIFMLLALYGAKDVDLVLDNRHGSYICKSGSHH